MAKKNTSIEINGRRYDAVSGKLLNSHGKGPVKSVDGISKPGHSTKSAARTASHAKPGHKVKPSATLMRHAVHKPTGSLKSRAKVQASTLSLTNESTPVVMPKLSLYNVDERREARAAKIALSKKISHFGALKVTPGSAPRPVIVELPEPAPPKHKAHKAPDVFERALAKSTSHHEAPLTRKQVKHAKRAAKGSRRALRVSTAALAVLLVGGFIAYQNVANVTLKVAARKAGFAATLPGYKPSGFAIGKFSYSAGNVAINFHSNSDSRHFALIEKPSNMDSSTLLNDYVASANSASYQTIQAGGQTVYVYGSSNATWVNNGVWYQVQGNNSLSDRQLAELASSM